MKTHPARALGFTLIELMVVVVVVAILTAVAYPSYRQHILKSRRNDCEGILTSAASALERNRAVTGSYGYPDDGNDENDAVGDWPAHFKLCPASNEKNVDRSKPPAETSYVVTRSVPTGGATETTFHLIATPAGAQTADKCGNLTLDHNGVKGASKGSVADCWR